MAFEEYTSQSTVNAEQIEEARSVITPQGAVTAQPGQWEVRYPDGNVRVLDDEAFQGEWGGGSGEEASQQPTAEKSLITQQSAGAESDSGTPGPPPPVTTAGAGSGSDTSRDSDKDSDSEATPSKRKARAKDKDAEEEDDEPPV